MTSLLSLRLAREEDGSVARAFAGAEEAVRQGPLRGAWACGPGCAFCCHLLVRMGRSESAALFEAVAARWEEIRPRVEANVARAAALDAAGYRAARIRCALLDDAGRCTAYAARPLACRGHASTSREACEAVFAGRLSTNGVPRDGWAAAACEALRLGLGGEARELHAALLSAARGGS